MPDWNLGDIMSEATARVGLRSDLDASVVSRLANEAYVQVASAAHHRELEGFTTYSLSSSGSSVSLPADFLEPINVSFSTTSVSSGLTLSQTNINYIDAEGQLPGAQPDRYALFGNNLFVHPSADTDFTLRLRYVKRPEELTALDDVPSIGTEWRSLILYETEALLFERLGERDRAAEARALYAAKGSALRDSKARNQAAQEKRGIRLVWPTSPY